MEDNHVEAFAYSRKSPDDKEDTEKSIKNQNELHVLTCNNKGWNLNSIEEDKDISGGDVDRRGLNTQISKSIAFKLINPNKRVYILVKDSKRFARNSAYFKEVWERLESNGVKIFSITKNSFIDYSDIGDRIISVVDEQIIFDAKNYAKLTEKLKISKGLPCIPAPFGYKYNQKYNFQGNKIPIDKSKSIFEWIIDKKASVIVNGVLDNYCHNVPCVDTVKQYRIQKTKYYRIIKNAKNGLYSGYIHYEKKIKDSNKKTLRNENVAYKGTHTPIISEGLFKKINPEFTF